MRQNSITDKVQRSKHANISIINMAKIIIYNYL